LIMSVSALRMLAVLMLPSIILIGCGSGGGSGSGGSADTTPNAFSFVDQTNVAVSTVITSNAVTITGIDAPAPISVVGGTYSVGCGATFTSTTSTISNNKTVCVGQITAATTSTATSTTLTVGGVAVTFISTTAPPGNAPPIANAGVTQNVVVGIVVTLNGSGSSDANIDPLTYNWALTSTPDGSAASLTGATSVAPTFTADLAGTYVASLVVSDGQADSNTATVTVVATIANAVPVANAGVAQNVLAGTVVTLSGSGSSDANGDPLTYNWTLTSTPGGSAASLTGATSVAPTFTADLAGTYVPSLVVSDGQADSNTATVMVTASTPPPPFDYYLFGGGGTNSVYLGCLTCNQFTAESVCNQFGTYGSPFASLSVWNEFGTYGSQFSSTSPWNQFSSSGPVVIGSDTLDYGVFTVNAFQFNRTSLQFLLNVLNFFSTTKDLAATRTYACGN
jgi:PKD domain